ncbi:unnamed protein product [[Candida] boidinii]|nr:unnamed protein product [[Candida] boidinii]
MHKVSRREDYTYKKLLRTWVSDTLCSRFDSQGTWCKNDLTMLEYSLTKDYTKRHQIDWEYINNHHNLNYKNTDEYNLLYPDLGVFNTTKTAMGTVTWNGTALGSKTKRQTCSQSKQPTTYPLSQQSSSIIDFLKMSRDMPKSEGKTVLGPATPRLGFNRRGNSCDRLPFTAIDSPTEIPRPPPLETGELVSKQPMKPCKLRSSTRKPD